MNITPAWGWVMIVCAGLLNATAMVLLKQSRLSANDSSWYSLILSPWFIACGICLALNLLLFAKALDRVPVSGAYPVLAGIGFVTISLVASQLFGERLNAIQYAGICLILIGIILTTG